jgi:SAM-dependent methyltransferase
MPSIEQNIRRWEEKDWSNRGVEWCDGFGGVGPAWAHALRPRIEAFLPAGHVLELGPGYGVWTDYLRPLAERMTLVDLAPNCIEFCRERFGGANMAYHVNDGRSLAMVEDGSIDFVFSFNSLVHADGDVMEEYVRQLGHKMRPGAWGFIHHSNLGSYAERLPDIPAPDRHWRGVDMTAERFVKACRGAGLACVLQELVPWGSPRFIDAISLFCRPEAGVEPPAEPRVEANADFWHQARAGDHTPGEWYRPGPAA